MEKNPRARDRVSRLRKPQQYCSLKTPVMKKKIEGIIAKCQKFVSNIEWHIKTNRQWGREIEKYEKELEIYKGLITELRKVLSN